MIFGIAPVTELRVRANVKRARNGRKRSRRDRRSDQFGHLLGFVLALLLFGGENFKYVV
jgi:hypothetical protein